MPPLGHDSTRRTGVLLHPTSLPSPWGVGDLGASARVFADRLAAAGLSCWQTLPLNPTTPAAGESPYFSNSSRAGNPLLISLEDLADDGLLERSEIECPRRGDAGEVDFARARALKEPLLRRATARLQTADPDGFQRFCDINRSWLDDHARFEALARIHGQRWRSWPEALKYRHDVVAGAIDKGFETTLAQEKALQYLFDRQWKALHERCRRNAVLMFGDMPIYVNMDSADVWADPQVFQLDERLEPRFEAGVPPDYFSATGQLWRNPVYDWDHLAATQFSWWVERLRTLLARFDVLRIDHFRGLAQYWSVEAGAEHARDGHWCDVPSTQLLDTLYTAVRPLPLVAEDLGTITPDVIELRDRYGLPGMIVLQFAFGDDNHDNPYKPENHRENAVAYLGTHDNNTALGWLEGELDDAARGRLGRYVNVQHGREGVHALVDLLLHSRAHTAIVCAQDLLALPAAARMNTPGEEQGNWRWQLTPEQFDALPLDWLGERSRAAAR